MKTLKERIESAESEIVDLYEHIRVLKLTCPHKDFVFKDRYIEGDYYSPSESWKEAICTTCGTIKRIDGTYKRGHYQ